MRFLDRTWPQSQHTFHIPVMGTGFTIDTPLKVARYGIASVVSLVDDVLCEQMGEFYAREHGEPYEIVGRTHQDPRARRITNYLNLMDHLLERQIESLQTSPFTEGSDITRYYQLLPDSPLKRLYQEMLETHDDARRATLQAELRRRASPGAIDANIMTKVDREYFRKGEPLPGEMSDALAALRGFANSTLRSSIILSAGLNQKLYSYIAAFKDFFPGEDREFRKKVVLKVSDYRSALVQGKFLAKRGIWVSEYRVESGLNCGGHTFATEGHLMGPILQEFKERRAELAEKLLPIYNKALAEFDRSPLDEAPSIRLTVQGGVGTAEEHESLLRYYEVDSVGWATPFLLVPEVTNVDDAHLKKLSHAGDDDVHLSDSSPFGIPFWSLRRSESEEARRQRIREGAPGSPCPKGYLKLTNIEFTKTPICTASRAYQKQKLAHLDEENLTPEMRRHIEEKVLVKSCICHDLAGGVTVKHGIDPTATPSVCCGPNIVNFSRIASLEEMVGHIYGRLSLLTNPNRPHMFIRELKLYIDHLRKEVNLYHMELSNRTPKYFNDFYANLVSGIDYYQELAERYLDEKRSQFLSDLKALQQELENLPLVSMAEV